MNQYLIYAHDSTDQDALVRRMNNRPAHLAGAANLKKQGNYIIGGAMLDDAGKMIGSTMIVQFNDYAGLRAWLDKEPYMLGKVWDTVEIKPFKLADV
ncbi:MAG TPA: YciI family protein [Sphingobacteriaceae bacterium]|nr:YciI family protein [Sphingobacteriaceae bacterium]